MEIKYLKDEKLNDLIDDNICLVDFYADWCGPCKMLSSILEELKEKVQIIKVNTDTHQELSKTYGIMSIPTLIFFKNKKETKKHIGYITKDELEKIINSL